MGRYSTRLRELLEQRPIYFLALAIGVYFAVSLWLSWLRVVELQTTTWDMGIYQQALWSTAHGRPFYEAPDLETGGFRSLLQVHSAFGLYAIVPLYAAWPGELTLLAVQSAVVAVAAIPLYFLARTVTGSVRLSLASGILYLAWAGTLSANLYDFHIESFLPVETLALIYLWTRRRYGAGFAVAGIGFLTVEILPVLAAGIGAYFLWESWTSLERPSVPETAAYRFHRFLRRPSSLAAFGLIVSSVVAYGALLWIRTDVLTGLLGTAPLVQGGQGYVIGATPASLGLAISNLYQGFGPKLSYWFLLFGLVGFLPLLAPRTLVLVAPWIVFTFLGSNLNYSVLGFQYTFIVAGPLLAACVFGLARLRGVLSEYAPSPSSAVAPAPPGTISGKRRARVTLAGLFVLLVALNLLLTPANPLLQNAGWGSGYRVSYNVPPGFAQVTALAALVPADGAVIATDNLFPLVANDPNAYSFSWVFDPVLALPFTPEHLPSYVLLAENRSYAVPSWLTNDLYNASAFGVRGIVWSSIAGTVLLFEAGYAGPSTVFGPEPPTQGEFSGASLAAAPIGVPVANASGSGGVVQSGLSQEGTMWYGPGISLPAGRYSVQFLLRADPIAGLSVPNGSTPVVWVGASAFGQPPFYGWSVPYAFVRGPDVRTVEFNLTLPEGTIELNTQGVVLSPFVEVTLVALSIRPAAG